MHTAEASSAVEDIFRADALESIEVALLKWRRRDQERKSRSNGNASEMHVDELLG